MNVVSSSGRSVLTHTLEVDGAEGRAFMEWDERPGATVEIVDIVVDDRRKGYGRALVSRLVELHGEFPATVYAITRLSNETARAFWAGVGFRETALLSRFYQDGPAAEAAVMYCLELNRPGAK